MIARKSALIVGTQFFTRFIGWIGLVAIARLWGGFAPEAMGIIGFSMSFLALFNFIANLGFSQAHVKRISEGKDLGTCIGTFATTKILLTSLMVLVVFCSIYLYKNFFNGGFYDATTESIIIVFTFYYVFLNLSEIATATFEGTREIAKRQSVKFFESIKTPLMLIVALAGVTAVGIQPMIQWPQFFKPLQQFLAAHSVGSLAMAYVFAMMSTFIAGMILLKKYPIKKPNWNLFKNYFSFALPILLISVIGVISVNIDKIMIGYFWTSIEVGYYFMVQQILQIVLIFHMAVSVVLFPTLSEYHSNKKINKINVTTKIAERYISMVMVPPLVIIIILAGPVINIMLSSAFLPAIPVLITLTAYTFLFSVNAPYNSLIGGINKPGVAAKIGLIIFTSNILLNCLFIPKNGILSLVGITGPTGAATATVLSTFIGFCACRYAARKYTKIHPFQSHTLRHIIAGIIMAVCIYAVVYKTQLFPEVYWYNLLLLSGLGLVIYLGVLFVLKEFNKDDFNFFTNIIHPKEMAKYVKSEMKGK